MRADRLLSMLMILQARGRATAGQLAEELEVSERTVYRDIDALSVAGVPVYTERGRGGGISLLDSYRTTLTGLTSDELRALFMLSIPSPLAALGVGAELRAALLKLSAALPAASRIEEQRVRQRILVDSDPWTPGAPPAPHLEAINRAVWDDRLVSITRRLSFGTEVEGVVAPYSLVAKEGAWHVVCDYSGDLRVHRVTEVCSIGFTGGRFTRRPDFDLPGFWSQWCRTRALDAPEYRVHAVLSAAQLSMLPPAPGRTDAPHAAIRAADGGRWIEVELTFDHFFQARAYVLGLGGAIRVIGPQPLVDSTIDFARQVLIVNASAPAMPDEGH
jgi:predicted DNA-binding transcriptional regulator YafY